MASSDSSRSSSENGKLYRPSSRYVPDIRHTTQGPVNSIMRKGANGRQPGTVRFVLDEGGASNPRTRPLPARKTSGHVSTCSKCSWNRLAWEEVCEQGRQLRKAITLVKEAEKKFLRRTSLDTRREEKRRKEEDHQEEKEERKGKERREEKERRKQEKNRKKEKRRKQEERSKEENLRERERLEKIVHGETQHRERSRREKHSERACRSKVGGENQHICKRPKAHAQEENGQSRIWGKWKCRIRGRCQEIVVETSVAEVEQGSSLNIKKCRRCGCRYHKCGREISIVRVPAGCRAAVWWAI